MNKAHLVFLKNKSTFGLKEKRTKHISFLSFFLFFLLICWTVKYNIGFAKTRTHACMGIL